MGRWFFENGREPGVPASRRLDASDTGHDPPGECLLLEADLLKSKTVRILHGINFQDPLVGKSSGVVVVDKTHLINILNS